MQGERPPAQSSIVQPDCGAVMAEYEIQSAHWLISKGQIFAPVYVNCKQIFSHSTDPQYKYGVSMFNVILD